MNDPLLELISNALGFMHPAFYDAAKPESAASEFYHQFRKLWDRGIPVGMGLGHLLIKPADGGFGITRLGEGGQPSEALAGIRFGAASPMPGFARTLAVTFQPSEPVPGVTLLHCHRGTVKIIE